MYNLRINTRDNRLIIRKTGRTVLKLNSAKKTVKVVTTKPVIRVISRTATIAVRKVNRSIKVGASVKRGLQGEPGKIQEITAGPGIVIDSSDEARPVVSATGGSGDKNYVQDFTMQHTLNVNHSLQKYPSVTVINSAGDHVVATVQYVDINNLIVQFTSPFSGRLTLN